MISSPRSTSSRRRLVVALILLAAAVAVVRTAPAEAAGSKDATIPPAVHTCPNNGAEAPTNGLQPHQIAAAYGIDKLWDQGFRGQGQHVALIEPGERMDWPAFQTFSECWGPFHQVHETVIGGGVPGEDGGEPNFDTEALLAVAPEVKRVDLFESAADDNSMYPALFRAALDPANTGGKLVDVISISFKNCEQSWTAEDIAATNAELQRAVDLGVKVFAAGGDSGSVGAYADGDTIECVKHPVLQPPPAGVELAVIFPAGSPLVTAVGGTELAIDGEIHRLGAPNGGTVTNEVVWNESAHPEGRYAGGGGQSSVFSIDSAPWQEAHGLTGMVHRPDIAALAGAPTYFSGAIGTSGASPMTAGGIAVVDSFLEHHGVTPPGFLNPVLYDLARTDYHRVFFDITDGNNDLYDLGCCHAGPGYDMASGLGALRFDQLAAVLLERHQSSTTTTTTVAPPPAPVVVDPRFTG